MSKKIMVIAATILALALAAGTAMAAKKNPGNTEPVVQAVQPVPATDSQAAPTDPVGPHYHGSAYYPGWTCGYYHPAGSKNAAPGQYSGWWGCGWGCW
jgi:hypothetical protein